MSRSAINALRALGGASLVSVVLLACSTESVAELDETPGPACRDDDECDSKKCIEATGTCAPRSCTDGRKNGTETDDDCGPACERCAEGKACIAAGDCASSVCAGSLCQAPTPSDGAKNGTETDVDCGGSGAPPCDVGRACAARDDCTTHVCAGGTCLAPTPADGEKNGTETDVDCGGPTAPACADLKTCAVASDCTSLVCTGAVCQVPTNTDTVKNGLETDVDCGGAGNPACAVGQGCAVNTDCTTLGCNYAKKCAVGRSCTRHFGGDTCGFGGEGSIGPAQWEDCCTTATVTPSTGPTSGTPVKLGKYQVTAGRMRAFLEDVGYDVRGFVQSARAAGKIPVIPGNAQGTTVLEPSWDAYLPTSFAGNTDAGEIADGTQGSATPQPGVYTSIRNHLGGVIFKNNAQSQSGCFAGAPGTHAFRFPDGQQDGDPPSFGQDLYDTKSMQCIDYLVGQAFCVWDGGRLELLQEWLEAVGPGTRPWSWDTTRDQVQPGTNTYYGCRFPWITDQDQALCGTQFNPALKTIEYAAWTYSYEYPQLPANSGDYIVFISAPGRTRGRGPQGHADLLANNFELTSNVAVSVAGGTPFQATHNWTGNGSWEGHGFSKGAGSNTMLLNKYGKLGLRCAYP